MADITDADRCLAVTDRRNGIGPGELDTTAGHLLFSSLQPVMAASGALGSPMLEDLLLARHQLIDHVLHAAVTSGSITQIVEIAAGMSPRGQSFTRQYGDAITYVEADLPAMARRKRDALDALGTLGAGHRVADLDARLDSGANSLQALARELDPDRGVAVITEGLLNYLPADAVRGLWKRISDTLGQFPNGLYLSDLYLPGDNAGVLEKTFLAGLQTFVRGREARPAAKNLP